MKASEKLIGKIKRHDTLGKVSVDSVHKSSRVLVEVTCIDRGKGYNEITGTYKGVKIRTGWYRGENRDFGHKDIAHINQLK